MESKNAILFSGQGAQYPGMFVELIKQSKVVGKIFQNASEITGLDLPFLCEHGSLEQLTLTENLQPLVLTCDIAAWELLKSEGIKCDYFAGYSLGEYAAIYAAGCCSLQEILELIIVRAKAMQNAVPTGVGQMRAVIFNDCAIVDNYFERQEKKVWISNRNTNGQYTISGLSEDMDPVCDDLKALGVMTKKVSVSAPFHCELMKPAAISIQTKLDLLQVEDANIPIVMNYDGLPEMDANEIKRKVCLQTYSTVQWINTLNTLKDRAVTNYIECGPGHVLSNFVKRMHFEGVGIYSVDSMSGCKKVCNALLDA